ncbi:serine/threonine protein kinase [Rhodococcus wratislaviensis]|nr:serine/threonine protein kinase [Rhodococcus sp. 3A]MBC2892613.1 serine/threonine protein kinase [Rhodococcus sp. 4CII]
MHDRLPLTSDTDLTLELVRITSYPSGLAVQLALTATGRPARRAWHETRPLTDPTDLSAHWSYLDVWLGTGDLAPADPYFLRPDLQAADAGICSYRSEPLYWLPASPARALTLATGWPQIGLPTAVTTMHLDPISQPGTPRRG